MRIKNHPILDEDTRTDEVTVTIEGKPYTAIRGEMIAATLMANGITLHRYTAHQQEPRGIFCGIGQCTDCVMTVNGKPNVRTCITPVEEGMVIEIQHGYGSASHD
jgi:predicted molibdopterin-dependent oxidoreductase YjgC